MINIKSKQDYSFLFSSMNNNSNSSVSGLSNLLGDYASIKNGSYGKLMKAYYDETSDHSVKSLASKNKQENNIKSSSKTDNGLTSDEVKAYNKVQTTTDSLNEAADALQANGTKSLFSKKEITTKDENGVESKKNDYDKDAIYNAVGTFVKDYNAVLDAAKDVDNTTISNRLSSMKKTSSIYSKSLSEIGITINDDSTLKLDKDKFMQADVSKVKNLFNSRGSYGYSVSVSSGLINSNADYALSKAATYNTDGNYSNSYNAGNLFNIYS